MRGHGPPPTPGSCHVPSQIPAPLPGLVLDIQLFPLGAWRLESKTWRLGLPRQTPALGTAALARPLRQVLARALLGWLCPPRAAGTPLTSFSGEKRGPGAPCNVLHPYSSLSPRAAPSLCRRGEGGHQPQPLALLLTQARLGNTVGTAEQERWLCPCIAPAGSVWPQWHPPGSGSRQSSGCRSRWFSLSRQQSQRHAAFSQAQRAP